MTLEQFNIKKDLLIEEYFNMKRIQNLENYIVQRKKFIELDRTFYNKLEEQEQNYICLDEDLRDMVCLLDASKVYVIENNIKKSKMILEKLSSKVINKIIKKEDLRFLDIRFFNNTMYLFDEADELIKAFNYCLEELEEYEDNKKYKNLKCSLYCHIAYNLMEIRQYNFEYNKKELDVYLKNYLEEGIQESIKTKKLSSLGILLIIKGIFDQDILLLQVGYQIIESLNLTVDNPTINSFIQFYKIRDYI